VCVCRGGGGDGGIRCDSLLRRSKDGGMSNGLSLHGADNENELR